MRQYECIDFVDHISRKNAAHHAPQAVPQDCNDCKSNHESLYDDLQATEAAQAG
jgi:hypothetical protein